MLLLFRWFALFILTGVVLAIGIWISDHPGDIQLDWLGYRMTTSLWVIAAALFACLIVIFVAVSTLFKCNRFVTNVGKRRGVKKYDDGLESLTQVIACLSSRDYVKGQQHLNRSRKLLGEELPLNVLLGAHIASKTGDKAALMSSLETMTEMPQTRFLAYRSLSAIADEEQRDDEALTYAKEAYALRPDLREPTQRYLGLLIKYKQFDHASNVMKAAKRHKVYARDELHYYMALCFYTASLDKEGAEALKLLNNTYTTAPSFPSAHTYINALLEQGKQRQAFHALYKAWQAYPHPDLSDIILQTFDSASPNKAMKRATALMQRRPDSIESHLVVARVALEMSQWDIARNHLKAALAMAPQMRVYRLLARLEEAETQDEHAAAEWLKRMQHADPNPGWHCRECGHHIAQWQSHCEHCEAFDSYVWESAHVSQPINSRAEILAIPSS